VKKREHSKRPYLPTLPHEIDPDAYLCFRLCHVCLFLNESPTEIIECQRCKRPLTVEPYLREHSHEMRALEEASEHFDEDEEEEELLGSPHAGMGLGRGLTGLSVLW
jgi:hypothetical protein